MALKLEGKRNRLLQVYAFLVFSALLTIWTYVRVMPRVGIADTEQGFEVDFNSQPGLSTFSESVHSPAHEAGNDLGPVLQQRVSDPTSLAVTKDDNNLDLILWTDSVTLFQSGGDFIVTREARDVEFVGGLEEVLNVEFRLCSVASCPEETQGALLPTQHATELKYTLNQNTFLNLYRFDDEEKRNDVRQIKAVTYWSVHYRRHVPLNETELRFQTCTGDRCPKPCPQNSLLDSYRSSRYPFKFDKQDLVCKSTLPHDLPPHRLWGGNCRCDSTCFTPAAHASNTTWPWASEEERSAFHTRDAEAKKERNKVRLRCAVKRTRRGESYDHRFVCDNATLPCTAFGDFKHHLYFIPKAKLVFCGIPKVGVTEWVKFFRYVMGAKDYLSLPHTKHDRTGFQMGNLDIGKALELLEDPTWTKAVFFRNPAERLLSAYLDKVVGQGYTQKIFRIGTNVAREEKPTLTFAQFVELVTNKTATSCRDPRGLKSCTDPHWKPQTMTCGLDHLLSKFDFIGSMDHVANHTKMLLEKVGLWTNYGKIFDDGMELKHARALDKCKVPPPVRDDDEIVWGFNQRGPSGRGGTTHATGSTSRSDEYYTPELLAKVREAYALDFSVWDDISRRGVDDIAAGRDLSIVKEFCSSQ